MTADQYTDILKTAIQNEMEAYAFYKNAADLVRLSVLKKTFADLAREELKHKVLLEGYASGETELRFDETKDYMVSQTIESPILSTDMRFTEAIALAMKKEEEAMKMYTGFAEASSDEQQKEMFMELSKMESGHKRGLEEIYVNTAFIEAW